MKIIDSHAHIFPDHLAPKASSAIGAFYDTSCRFEGTVSALLESGRAAGVSRYLVHSTATRVDQVGSINNFIMASCASRPEFIGFGTLHPDFPGLDDELERIVAGGLLGIKLHPDFQAFTADDPRLDPVYELLSFRSLPVLIHAGDARYDFSGPKRLARVLDRHPRLVMIAAHFGGYTEWDDALDCLAGRELWFDTSSSLWKLEREKALKLISIHGASRFLFGSDYPMWDHCGELARLEALGLASRDMESILWKNASRLFGVA